MSELSRRIRHRREELGLSQEELADRMGYRSKSSITKLEKGVNDLPQSKLEELAAALHTTSAWLLGLDIPAPPPGFEPLPAMAQVPLVGSIACGTPITAEQNIECYIGVPAAWHADFALTCHGNSMAPTICDGDIVCIRRQPEVEQGEIAAVRVGEEATLKHFHRQGDAVMLLADNAAVCPPMIYTGTQLEELQIEGKAVGFCRGLEPSPSRSRSPASLPLSLTRHLPPAGGSLSQRATTTTAASGRNREELLGQWPARYECRPRHEISAGSHNPLSPWHTGIRFI